MAGEEARNVPKLVPEDYKTLFTSDCALFRNGTDWYKGTGICPQLHPLFGDIDFRGCPMCQSNKVLVIAAQYSLSYVNGDRYWDYEIECQDCHRFSQQSYAENG